MISNKETRQARLEAMQRKVKWTGKTWRGKRVPWIQNTTGFDTQALRVFCRAGIEAMGMDMRRTIKVRYARSGSEVHGWAFFNSKVLELILPKPWNGNPLNLYQLGQVLEHELEHNLGLDHKHMPNWWMLPVRWAHKLADEGFTIPHRDAVAPGAAKAAKAAKRAAKAATPPQARWAAKLAHAQQKQREWGARAKAAVTRSRKWGRKVAAAKRALRKAEQ